MLGSMFEYNFIADLIFLTLYSASTDCSPHPPFFLDKYDKAVDDAGCFAPFVTMLLDQSFLVLSAVNAASTWVAYWLEAITRLASDIGLDQITETRCGYVFSARSSVLLSSWRTFSRIPTN